MCIRDRVHCDKPGFAQGDASENYVPTTACNRSWLASTDEGQLPMEVWDTAQGQQTLASLRSSTYEGSKVLIIAFDTTCRDSLLSAQSLWLPEFLEEQHEDQCSVVLVGTKADTWDRTGAELGEFVTRAEANKIAAELGSPVSCIFTSASTGAGVLQPDLDMTLHDGRCWSLAQLLPELARPRPEENAVDIDLEWAVGTHEYEQHNRYLQAQKETRAELAKLEQALAGCQHRLSQLDARVIKARAAAEAKAARVQTLRRRAVARWRREILYSQVIQWDMNMKSEKKEKATWARMEASTLLLKRAVARWQRDEMRTLVLDWNAHMRAHFAWVKRKYEQEASVLLMKRAYVRWQLEDLKTTTLRWNAHLIEHMTLLKKEELALKKENEAQAVMLMKQAMAKWQKDVLRQQVLAWRRQVLEHLEELRRVEEERCMLIVMEREFMLKVFERSKATWRFLQKEINQPILQALERFWPEEVTAELNQDQFEARFMALVAGDPGKHFGSFDLNHDGLISRWEFFKEIDNKYMMDAAAGEEWLRFVESQPPQSPKSKAYGRPNASRSHPVDLD
eukprot:TRINITY_DN27472_c0_g1_i2.p1 TRINITY_DN27472_c0_g1~~TRINITY_DN27472_c0_g1_i2.p1  ORF type:complete len:565 (-),score=159.26 TRINITY_DN27472_c0_g1_i2:214-1908(-)